MQSLNLNNTQKNLLQWLVENVRAGKLDEDDIWITWTQGGARLMNCEDDIPDIKKTTLDALENNGCILCNRSRENQYRCSLTGKAYQVVDSNFDALNLSAIPFLIPLTEVKHLDTELWERCRLSLSAEGSSPKAWDKAVRTAMVVLEERLRKLGKTEAINPDATGEAIVNIIFAGKLPVLSGKLDEKQLKAYRDLYAGMMTVFRNRYAHRIVDPDPESGGAIIVFVDLLLKILDDFDWKIDDEEA